METKQKAAKPKTSSMWGIFTAIYFVIFFAGMMLVIYPILIPLCQLVCPIFVRIPFMLYLTKVVLILPF